MNKPFRGFSLLSALALLASVCAYAEDLTAPAVTAMQSWLKEIDSKQYAQSWTDSAPTFQKALTSEKWVSALEAVRTPLGECKKRTLSSASHQTEVPSPTGPQKGDFVIATFDASFEAMPNAVETVCFERAPDGNWKASGYYIKPKS